MKSAAIVSIAVVLGLASTALAGPIYNHHTTKHHTTEHHTTKHHTEHHTYPPQTTTARPCYYGEKDCCGRGEECIPVALVSPDRIIGECHPTVHQCVFYQGACGDWRCDKYTEWLVNEISLVNHLDPGCHYPDHECFFPQPSRLACPAVWDDKHPCRFHEEPLKCDRDACCHKKGRYADGCAKGDFCKWVDCRD